MESKIVIANTERIVRQRNLFLLLTIILAVSCLLLSWSLTLVEQRIVLVPGLNQTVELSKSRVSRSYLEEVALLFLSHLLDISEGNVNHKKELVLKHTSDSSSTQINEYFAKVAKEYKRFSLSTHFTAKNLLIDEERLEVIAKGILTSWYGKNGHQTKEVSYFIRFNYMGGALRLLEFGQVAPAEEQDADKETSSEE